MDPALKIDGLSVRYGRSLAVEEVSLTVRPGEVVTLLGANGAGKTSVIRAATGLLGLHDGKVVAGTVAWGGRSILGRPAASIVASGLAQTFEGRRLFADLTVEENLWTGAYRRRDRKAVAATLDELCDSFPRIAEKLSFRAGLLSGGEQQLVAMGRALMSGPKVLLCDEPTLGLAPIAVEQVLDMIVRVRERGIGVLLVEQSAVRALSIADHAHVMKKGRLVHSGTGVEIAEHPELVASYLGDISDISEETEVTSS